MDLETAIQELDTEWDQIETKGFFSKLQMGVFDEERFKHLQTILNTVQIPEGETLDRRFVEVTWLIPTFMRWQQDVWRIDGKDTQQLDDALSFVEQRLTTVLGLP